MQALSPVLARGLGSMPGPKTQPHGIFLGRPRGSRQKIDRVLDPANNHTTSGREARNVR
jgi:hypothetical protein